MVPRKPTEMNKLLKDFKADSMVVIVDKLGRRWRVLLEQPGLLSTHGVTIAEAPKGFGEMVGRKWYGLDPLIVAVKSRFSVRPKGGKPAEEWVVNLASAVGCSPPTSDVPPTAP